MYSGNGTTPFGALDAGIKELGTKAVVRALDDADVERPDVGALYAGNFVGGILEGQATIGPILADEVGLSGVPAMTTEGACASSGIAFQQAHQAIATAGFLQDSICGSPITWSPFGRTIPMSGISVWPYTWRKTSPNASSASPSRSGVIGAAP